MTVEWPNKILVGTPRSWNLDHLYHNKTRDGDSDRSMHYGVQAWLMGYILPPFQRPVVWDDGRMIRFVESAVLGFHLGTWCYNNAGDAPMRTIGGKEYFHKTDLWLIDGQQRLTALDRFFDDYFPVFGLFWSEVPTVRKRGFLSNTSFGAHETKIHDETTLRNLYDRLNFGGVAHTEDQRASGV